MIDKMMANDDFHFTAYVTNYGKGDGLYTTGKTYRHQIPVAGVSAREEHGETGFEDDKWSWFAEVVTYEFRSAQGLRYIVGVDYEGEFRGLLLDESYTTREAARDALDKDDVADFAQDIRYRQEEEREQARGEYLASCLED